MTQSLTTLCLSLKEITAFLTISVFILIVIIQIVSHFIKKKKEFIKEVTGFLIILGILGVIAYFVIPYFLSWLVTDHFDAEWIEQCCSEPLTGFCAPYESNATVRAT